MTYRYVGAVPDTLASGQPVSLGDKVDLSAQRSEDSHNQMLIDEGRLIALPKTQRVNHPIKDES